MKLDIDCVRDVMLELEGLPMGSFPVESFTKSVEKYGEKNVVYTFAKLKEANYINAYVQMVESGDYYCPAVYCLTFDGHEFLETIREPDIWKRLSGVVINGGTGSIKVIMDIAIELAKQAAAKKLGIE